VGEESAASQDPDQVVATLAGAFLEAHRTELGPGRRFPAPSAAEVEIGPLKLIGMFFSFLGSTIVNSVENFPRRVVDSVSRKIASGTQKLVLGNSDPAFVVVVGRVRADGKPAGWREVAAQMPRLTQAVGAARSSHNLAPVWDDFAKATRTLGDGGERGSQLRAPAVGGKRQIVKQPERILPDPQADPFLIDPEIAGQLGVQRVEPGDVITVMDLNGRLGQLAADPLLGSKAGPERASLEDWARRTGRTFAHHVGHAISSGLLGVQNEIAGRLREIQALEAEGDAADALAQTQRALRRRLLVWLGVFVLAGVLLGVASIWLDLISGAAAAIIAAVLTLIWLIGSFLTFFSGQRDLFNLLKRANRHGPALDAAWQNLREALADHERLVMAYGQYLSWTAICGEFLHRPFGRVAPPVPPEETAPVGLPAAVQFGVVSSDPPAASRVVADLRQSSFRPGWLEAPWTAALGAALPALGPEAQAALQNNPARLFADYGAGADSWLVRWQALIERDGVGARPLEVCWGAAARQLAAGSPLRDQLMTTVRVSGRNLPGSATAFATALAGAGGFEQANSPLLSPEASVHGVRYDGPGRVFQREGDLSCTATLTQTSGAVRKEDVLLFAQAPRYRAAGEPAPDAFADDLPPDLAF
ncbi:MAG: hypothetical protein LBL01_03750, partial [Bifidobacteriaceae bacterium]|jgi:hypothetical protein|nr:hypothetical protein [Bifidobacteriaceae bacterium]